jgi:hypothetical protein
VVAAGCCSIITLRPSSEDNSLSTNSTSTMTVRRPNVCAGARFIYENQLPSVDRGLPLSPLLTRRFDVFAILFGSVQRFF